MSTFIHQWEQWIVRRMTASHLAGPDISDAIRISRKASERGWSCTFGYWNNPLDTPETAALAYRAALKIIPEQSTDCYLSIKAPVIKYDTGILMDLAGIADQRGIRIHFDAMDPSSVSPTFDLLERTLKFHKNFGYTLPSRWRRSIQDAERIIDYGIPVRIVKGQWADPSAPGLDSRKNYLAIVRKLSGRAAHVAVATHDRILAKDALQALKEAGTPSEMEQLSSLPQNCARLARDLEIPVRIYIPYGYPSLPYDIWQARTRPAIMAWAMRDFIEGKHRKLTAIR